MIIARIALVALLLFGAVSIAGAMGVILALLFGPRDPYDEALKEQEQLEYIERWKREAGE